MTKAVKERQELIQSAASGYPAFGILYVAMWVPIGWLVERARRRWIIYGAMIVWLVATAASGLATRFWQLIFMAVGLLGLALGIFLLFLKDLNRQIVAVCCVTISLSGLFLWSSTVGSLSSRFFGEDNLNLAMATLSVLYGTIPLLFIPVTWILYRRKFSEFEPV